MTTPTAAEVERRKAGRARKPRTLASALGAAFVAAAIGLGAGDASASAWPSAKYREKPVQFFREVLGVEPWEKQIEVIEAARDHKRVAVRSGHKVSKSHTAGGLALWFFESFEDARVVMSSTTSRQVDQILWREVKMMHARAGVCAPCKRANKERAARGEQPGPRPCPHSALLDGEPMQLARTGLRSDDFREIVGFTAREAEAVAGISGKNLLYILDEASGIPNAIFEAIEGNRAGGARVVMFSNPTRSEGEFYEAFDSKAEFYKTITISSEETPNVQLGREVIPGLATREWIDEKKREWGEESALYKIRVKGLHVLTEDGKIVSVHAITEAERRWREEVEVVGAPPRLHIGLDPAGPGVQGDETAFVLRRGYRMLGILPFRGLTEEAHLAHLLGAIKVHSSAREFPPLVKVDREGDVGARVYGILRAHLDVHANDVRPPFELVGVRSSEKAQREPTIYDRVRDELWASLAQWLREGGAIVEDVKLAKELHAPEWIGQVSGRMKATSKDDLRKLLGRSPDRADALALAVWEAAGTSGGGGRGGRRGDDNDDDGGPGGDDAYALPSSIDPYGGTSGGIY